MGEGARVTILSLPLSTMRALVTGITGFVGSHLAVQLLNQGATVYGLARRPSSQVPKEAALFEGSILDQVFLEGVLRRSKPTHIFHFAGVIGSPRGGRHVLLETNVIGTTCLFEAISAVGIHPRVLVPSSSAVYGAAFSLPITEATPMCPVSTYGASKAAQEMVALQAHLGQRLPVIRVRGFNLVGPGQSRVLVASSLARQIARGEVGGERVIRVGNLFPRRDFVDVRDAARCYIGLARHGECGDVYNVCSGTSTSIQTCADILLARARVPLSLEVATECVKCGEISEQVGSLEKTQRAIDWAPKVSLEQSLSDLLDYWRQNLELVVGS